MADIKQNICPKCGGPTEEGLCGRCRAKETDWMICEARVYCTRCPTCGSLKTGSIWSDTQLEREELIESLALSGVKLHEDVEEPSVTISHYDPGPNRTMTRVSVSAILYGVPVSKSCDILIVWSGEQCDRCSRLAGSYYAGVIQVRAEGRKPDAWEKERAASIASTIEDSFQANGDRLSFISKIEETKDGVDIVISSHSIGENISKEITARLGGKYTRHPKLIGEKKGKQVYRITYSVRLPKFRKGDVIVINGSYYEVRSNDSGIMRLFDLKDGEIKFVNENEPARLVGNVLDSETALVAYREKDMLGLLDPRNYETVECQAGPWIDVAEGGEIRFLRDRENDAIVLLG